MSCLIWIYSVLKLIVFIFGILNIEEHWVDSEERMAGIHDLDTRAILVILPSICAFKFRN